MAETQVQRIMRILKCGEAEAVAITESDRAIDRGLPQPFDLPPEKLKNTKQYRTTGTKKPTIYDFSQRKRKKNAEKAEIIAKIAESLGKSVENLVILNPERQISFKIGENLYEITLTQKRK